MDVHDLMHIGCSLTLPSWQPFLTSSLLLSLGKFPLTFSRLQVIQDGTTPLHSC